MTDVEKNHRWERAEGKNAKLLDAATECKEPRGIANDLWYPRRPARRRLMPPGASTFDVSKVEAIGI
jgi:hypothetical protein